MKWESTQTVGRKNIFGTNVQRGERVRVKLRLSLNEVNGGADLLAAHF